MTTKDFVRRNFGRLWPAHVENLVMLLIECRKAIGDLDTVLLLSAIGDRSMSSRKTDWSRTDEELYRKWEKRPAPENINLQSLSDFTGVPRETARRKVSELIERGWVERTSEGYFVVTRKCAADLEPATERGIEYLADMYSVFRSLPPR